jgi:hypothetical protein
LVRRCRQRKGSGSRAPSLISFAKRRGGSDNVYANASRIARSTITRASRTL